MARHLFYPVQDALCGRDSLGYWRKLEASQWWSSTRLQDLQCIKLQRVVQHSVAQTPFYEQRFRAAGIDAAAVRGIEDLRDLPLLSKDDIREWCGAMLARSHHREVAVSCTSGSTGAPLIFGVGPRRCASDISARMRAHRWFDINIGDPVVYLWGSRIEIDHQDRLKAVRDWLINERLLSAFEMSESRLHRYGDIFLRLRPQAVYSYASTLWRFARFVAQHRPELHQVVRRAAFATGECLLPHWRADIEGALGCAVVEEYGCREGGLIAHQCPAGSYHIMAENVIVEILDDSGQAVMADQEGHIVVTNLEAYAMPFIRYDTGDRAALRAERCRCGRALPLMDRPTGRSFEFLETHDGTRITGVSLSRDFKEIEGIDHYRIVQESRRRVRVLVVAGRRYDRPRGEQAVVRFVKARIGEQTEVHIEYFQELPPHPSGKYRYVINAMQS